MVSLVLPRKLETVWSTSVVLVGFVCLVLGFLTEVLGSSLSQGYVKNKIFL